MDKTADIMLCKSLLQQRSSPNDYLPLLIFFAMFLIWHFKTESLKLQKNKIFRRPKIFQPNYFNPMLLSPY